MLWTCLACCWTPVTSFASSSVWSDQPHSHSTRFCIPHLLERFDRPLRSSLDAFGECLEGHCFASIWPVRWQSSTETNCRSEEHTSELQSQSNLVCRLL